MKKKLLTMFLVFITITSSLILTASAEDICDNTQKTVSRIGPEFEKADYTYLLDDELKTVQSLEELAVYTSKRIEAEGFISGPKVVYETLEQLKDPKSPKSPNSTLIEKELIAVMCTLDGITSNQLILAETCAEAARTYANNTYNDGGGLRDSCRHFVWNFLMTHSITKANARIVACNYEWGRILLPYAETKYDEYISNGYPSSTAATYAYAYAYDMRVYAYALCEYSQNTFNNMFTDDSIRDLWNNCYGRAYAEDYGSLYFSSAFSAAINAGELINSDSDVTSTHRWSIWSWDWYTA